LDLALRQRPHLHSVDATWQRVRDPLRCEHVRRAGDEKPSRPRVSVHRLLERQQQAWRAVNLIDERRPSDVGDEASRIRDRCLARRRVVEVEGLHRMLAGDDLGGQRRLADLPRARDEHDP
jgi:hypothetical protein